jgi:malate dehydrogenase (oxaloacetate-decarboxylating)
MNTIDDMALELHKKFKGKITTKLRDDNEIDREKLSAYYSPGVAAISREIVKDEEKLRDYTWTNNLVAVISDGSAVLGLGDIGPKASLPVMEGKALLFKYFADIDSVPIILDVHSEDEIVEAIKAIAPSFGAINLEDIAAPKCFAIEERLKNELNIPVFHDDQHGTAIVVLAGLINSMKVVGKDLSQTKIVVVGAGAAGTAIAKLLSKYAKPEIIMVDSKGAISKNRSDLNSEKIDLLNITNPNSIDGSLGGVLDDADIFIGVSKANLLTADDIKKMAEQPVVFGLANPDPEIEPSLAKQAGVAVLATGRSDLPNQVNNAVAFPGIFRGALDNNVTKITDDHKIAAAEVIAKLIVNPTPDEIIPSIMDKRLVPTIAEVIT